MPDFQRLTRLIVKHALASVFGSERIMRETVSDHRPGEGIASRSVTPWNLFWTFLRGLFSNLQTLFTSVWDLLFGFDYFIAHRSLDGNSYAKMLHERLTKTPNRFRCFIDLQDYSLGGDLSLMQTQALARTTRLIVVVTPAAHEPPTDGRDWLLGEVREFKSRRKEKAIVVPIGTRQTLNPAAYPASPLLREIPYFPDDNCLLEADELCLLRAPSDETLARLALDFRERRQEQIRLRIFQGLTAFS
jgi:hypothetical protein